MTKREIAEQAADVLAWIGICYCDNGHVRMRIKDDEIDDVIQQARDAADDIAEAMGELRAILEDIE